MSTILLALAIVALILGAVEELRAEGKALLPYAVILLSVIEIIGRV